MMLNPLRKLFLQLSPRGRVLDLGCMRFRQVTEAKLMGKPNLEHFGVDIVDLRGTEPAGFQFRMSDLARDPIPFEDDFFDLVVCWHIIEHLLDGVAFFGECVRVCRPGGMIYLEAPSERSLWLPSMPFDRDEFFSLSYYDDPTHTHRPWTPQSLHRLTRCYDCTPVETGYRTSWKHRLAFPVILPLAILTRNGALLERCVWYALGWSSYLVAQKPSGAQGSLPFTYRLSQASEAPLDRPRHAA